MRKNSILESGRWGSQLNNTWDLGGKGGVEAPVQKMVARYTLEK